MSSTETPDLKPPVGADDHTRGPETAPLTLTVFGDYECPYTRRAMAEIADLRATEGDRFRLVYRHFPLRDIHPHAEAAAELAEAATAVGRFWEVHDHLFAHQKALGPGDLAAYAVQFGVPSAEPVQGRFQASATAIAQVQEDVDSGIASGVEGTPSLFIEGYRYLGGYDAPTLGDVLRRLSA